MIVGFFVLLAAGHFWMITLVLGLQLLAYKEVIALAHEPSRKRTLPYSKTLNWYFLASTVYYLYGDTVLYYFEEVLLVDRVLFPFAIHHRFISYMLYIIGMLFIFHFIPIEKTNEDVCRIYDLCIYIGERPLSISVYAVCIHARRPLPHRSTSTFHSQEHNVWHVLVLFAGITSHYQRYICLPVRYHFWENTAYQNLAKENC